MTYQQWSKIRLTRSDRRFAQDLSSLFYMNSKLRITKLSNSISTYLRKKKINGNPLSAGDVQNDDFINVDSGFKVFSTDRGSPTFWSDKMKVVMATIRQIGKPHLFLTVSAAETEWLELIVILINHSHTPFAQSCKL